jgi:thiol-disulfide isomerase/thioredoxin
MDGRTINLSDFYGKPIVLNFWASWCPPCKSEMPDFDKVYADVKDDIVFLMVDLVDGQRETIETGKRFIADQGYSFPVYFDTTGDASNTFDIEAIPTTFFIDKNGNINSYVLGAISENALRQSIEKIK